ncbi:hypothetical protein [Methylocella sp.]|uniref:hypothetical protein n=1 Tax=Methylocella sp. TaxID=1978226 RepID=UPI0035B2F3DB
MHEIIEASDGARGLALARAFRPGASTTSFGSTGAPPRRARPASAAAALASSCAATFRFMQPVAEAAAPVGGAAVGPQ